MKQPETEIYKALSKYISLKYPTIIYRFDFAAGLKMSVGQIARHKLLNPHKGYPDLFIAEPRGNYYGLFLEIKASENSPYKKGGGLVSDKHVQEQYNRLMELSAKGYHCDFAVGLDDCMRKVDKYLGMAMENFKPE